MAYDDGKQVNGGRRVSARHENKGKECGRQLFNIPNGLPNFLSPSDQTLLVSKKSNCSFRYTPSPSVK